jgi:hypothetical protein
VESLGKLGVKLEGVSECQASFGVLALLVQIVPFRKELHFLLLTPAAGSKQ